MSSKKNQHFLPKFYLRFFSIEENKKTIGLYAQKGSIYTLKAEIKHESSKNFYYDKDGSIETALEETENHMAPVLQSIINKNEMPFKGSISYGRLLFFLTLTQMRNPVQAKKILEAEAKFYNHMKDKNLAPEDRERIESRTNPQQAILTGLKYALRARKMLLDLNCGLIVNKTQQPFITSDNPVLCHNQFLEQKRWHLSGQGFGCKGMQYFIPLTPFKLLVFYDPWCYKLGNKKDQKTSISNIESIEEVNALNLMQVLNCDSKIYFNQ